MPTDQSITTDDDLKVTLDMISVGVEVYNQFNPEQEDPEALVFAIIYRAFEIAKRNRAALQQIFPVRANVRKISDL